MLNLIIRFQAMDPEDVEGRREKTLAEERNELTPNGLDDAYIQYESNSDDESGSLEQIDEDQPWDDDPTPKPPQKQAVSEHKQHKQQQEEKPEQQIQILNSSQAESQKQSPKISNKEQQVKKEQVKKEQAKREQQVKREVHKRGRLRQASEQEKKKTYNYCPQPEFIYAIYYLFMKQVQDLLPENQVIMRCNPVINSKAILLEYYDEKYKNEAVDKIDDFIVNNITVVEIERRDVESGLHLSKKYRDRLLKQDIAIFYNRSSKGKNKSGTYYICGRATKQILLQKVSELRKFKFIWFCLYNYRDTRSYQVILSHIFQLPDMISFVQESMNVKDIEVARVPKDFPKFTHKTGGVLAVFTYCMPKNITIFQEVDQAISKFIKETYYVICFTFKSEKCNKFAPKIENATFFFIHDKHADNKMSYLFIIVKKQDYKEAKPTIEKEIEAMKLNVSGRRYFKNFEPQIFHNKNPNYKEMEFPSSSPYSWTIYAKKDYEFNWKAQLII